jgi:hypothetical protein
MSADKPDEGLRASACQWPASGGGQSQKAFCCFSI